MAIQSTFYTVFTAEPSAFAVVPSPSRDAVDIISQLAVGKPTGGNNFMRAWAVPPHSAVVIRGTPGATRSNNFVRALAVSPHSMVVIRGTSNGSI